jgi:hypothetical protein
MVSLFLRLLAVSHAPPNLAQGETQTWSISEEVSKVLQRENWSTSRAITTQELKELANYLDVLPTELKGPFLTDKRLTCTECGRRLTILDFVKTAVESHGHAVASKESKSPTPCDSAILA